MDDSLSRHGRDGAGAPIWRYAGTRTRAAVGGFRQRGPAPPIRFSHADLVWDQVAIRLLCIRCDVLRPISGSRRLESMDRRLSTMMLHEVEKRAISSTQRLLQPGLARAWLRRTPRGLSVCLYGAQSAALHRAVRKARSRRPLAKRCSTFAFGSYPWPLALDVERAFHPCDISTKETND